jgi:hypothetical protein
MSDDEKGNFFHIKSHLISSIVEVTTTKVVQRRINFADPPSSLPTTRWSDNIPNEYEQNEMQEFGTPIAASQPPQLNTVR